MVDPIPADAFYDLTDVTDLAVSPDGDRVAFVADEFDADDDERVSSLFVVPADGSRDPHRLTRASEASAPAWSPDGSKLGFLAARETDAELRVARRADDAGYDDTADAEGTDDGGEEADETADADEVDEDGSETQLWVFDLERGGDARQVTDREEGVGEFDWATGGERLVVAARDPTAEQREYLRRRREGGPIETERLQHKFDGNGWLDDVRTYLFVVDLETRESRRLDDAYGGGAMEARTGLRPCWGAGDRIAFLSNRTDRPDDSSVADVYTIAPDGSDCRRLTDGDVMARRLAWNPAGDRVAFTARRPDNWYVPGEMYVGDPAAETYESVSAGLDRTVGRSTPRWLDDETLLALVGDGGRTRICRFHVDGTPERVFERQSTTESLDDLDAGGGRLAFVTSRPADGADVYAMDVETLAAGDDDDPRTRLTTLNGDLVESHPMPGCRRVTFESEATAPGDEQASEAVATVEAIAYHPPDFDPDDPDPRPLVLAIHGGPMSYDEPSFDFQDAYFTSRGYVVLKVNYRGSTSYGRAFCEVLKGAWGTVDVADLQAGVDELIDRGWADPDRLFPTGFSQGGVNTGYLVTREDRWAAAAAEHGVYDYRSAFGTDDSHNWWKADYGLPWENPEAYDEHSIITDVGVVETPLLVTAGEEDWRCPPTQAEQLYVSVRKQGVPAKLVVYPDEHHNLGDPDRAIHRLEELSGWFERFDPARDGDE